MKKLRFLSLFACLTFGSVFAQSDDCFTATQLTPSFTSCNYETGTSAGATQSRPGGACGNSDDDVWFYFVANSSVTTIQVDPSGGYDAAFDLYDGSCAGNNVLMGGSTCRDALGTGLNEKYQFTNLVVGNTYYLRVWHRGTGSGSDAFRVCVFGVPAPSNTGPCSAFSLPSVTPACNFKTYELINTGSSSVPTPSGCNLTGSGSSPTGFYSGGDMWFSVIVPASGNLEISTLPVSGGGLTDLALAIYSGFSCSSLTQISCNGDRSASNFMPYLYETGLTPGNTVYIRIWDESNNANGLFKLCVSSPDNGTCPTALNICDINGYGGTTSDKYIRDTPDNMRGKDEAPPGGVFGIGYTGVSPVQIDNNSWIVFRAASSTATFTVSIDNCINGNGLQMQIFSGNSCTNFAPVSNFLETSTSQVITASGLTPGDSYYIVIDGFAGDVCSYEVTANSGVQTVTATASSNSICTGDNATVNANVFGTGSFTYTWYSVPAGGPYPSTPSINVSPTQDTEYFVDITGACGAVTTASAKILVGATPTAPSVSATQTNICPSSSTTITAAGTLGATYDVYTAATGGTLLGSTPYVFSPGGVQGSTTLYVEAVSGASCVSASRTPITINATDNVAPTISCPANQVVNVNATCSYILPDFTNTTTVTDNCYSAVTNVTQSPVAGTTLTGHNTNQTVTITATDSSGNISTCSFVVNLQDRQAPTLVGTCPNDTIVIVDTNCMYIMPDYTGGFTTSDNCTLPGSIVYQQLPAPGDTLSGVGTFTRVYVIAVDGANNRDTCDFLLTLQDSTPAVINCPGDFIDTTDLEECAYLVPDFSSLITLTSDNCANSGGGANITQTPLAGTAIDITQDDVVYPVTITYTDGSGNTSNCSFNVTATCVRDLIIPQFISPNGDNINDFFVIQNITAFPEISIRVFNRWENLVYQMDNYDNSWDGKKNVGVGIGSEYLPDGVYYYIISIPDEDDVSGFVYIERD